MTLRSLQTLIQRTPGYRPEHLLDLFPAAGAFQSLVQQEARARLLLDIQDLVMDEFVGLVLDPHHTVGFQHHGSSYLAAHYDWGGSIVKAALVSAVAREFAILVGMIEGEDLFSPNDGDGRAELFTNWLALKGGLVTTADNRLTRGIHNTCFRNTGYTYANVIDAFDVPDSGDAKEPLDLRRPSLLFFNRHGYLVGCGYIRPLTPASNPDRFAPELAPLRSEWFAHPAGTHTDDGGFEIASDHGHHHDHNHGRQHGASWDIHIWFNVEEPVIHQPGLGTITQPSIAVGVPIVGPTTAGSYITAPPNVGRNQTTRVVDKLVCADGAPSPGFYVSPESII